MTVAFRDVALSVFFPLVITQVDFSLVHVQNATTGRRDSGPSSLSSSDAATNETQGQGAREQFPAM